MKGIYLLFVVSNLISCKGSHFILTEAIKTDCFWDITGDNQVLGGLNSSYRFFPDGKCYFYYYNFYNKKRTDSVYRFEDVDIIVPPTWSTVGDTLLIARGTVYKVLEFSPDSIIVTGYGNDSLILRKNCKTILEKPSKKSQ